MTNIEARWPISRLNDQGLDLRTKFQTQWPISRLDNQCRDSTTKFSLTLSLSFFVCLFVCLSLSLFLFEKCQAVKFFSGSSDFGLYLWVIRSLGPRNWAVNCGLPLTAGPFNSGLFSIAKAYKNLGPKQTDCYWRFAVIAGTERTWIMLYFLIIILISHALQLTRGDNRSPRGPPIRPKMLNSKWDRDERPKQCKNSVLLIHHDITWY